MSKLQVGIAVGIGLFGAALVLTPQLLPKFIKGVPAPSPVIEPTSAPSVSASGEISVTAPQPGQTVGFRFTIAGLARAFENVINYKLTNSSGKVLSQGPISVNASDTGLFGPYNSSVVFSDLPGTPTGTLTVLTYSARDGSEQNIVSIPVKFASGESTLIKVFMQKYEDEYLTDCTQVLPLSRRIPKNAAIGKAAIEELLQGPTEEESRQGYKTAINTRVGLNSLTIGDGVARVDFDRRMQEEVGGSCRVGAIRSQIETTLKQFPTVKSVVISVDGNVEEALQP